PLRRTSCNKQKRTSDVLQKPDNLKSYRHDDLAKPFHHPASARPRSGTLTGNNTFREGSAVNGEVECSP
ncbi:hypothetical protein, partial [Mesorhizobium sp. M0859]|uniref:hypothetical protein n=1 Tax=Mesorhizobium sp. M0859 TaxID=2957014 RepID=UPI00333B7E91